MAISLEKGQRIEIGLSKVSVGLGWDPNEGSGFDFDLDASAFMLGGNKKLPKDEFFVFYNNQKSPDGAVESTGDDLTGGNSDGGDDETLNVDLTKVDPQVQEIIFTATIYKAEERKQNPKRQKTLRCSFSFSIQIRSNCQATTKTCLMPFRTLSSQ